MSEPPAVAGGPQAEAQVEKEHDGDSIIYVYRNDSFVDISKEKDPLKIKKVGRFIPNHVTERITAQAGLFTVHPNPTESFVSPQLDRWIITDNFRRDFKRNLYQYGIHRTNLFPGLDGLAAFITWARTDIY